MPMIRAQTSIATPERKSEMTEDHLLQAVEAEYIKARLKSPHFAEVKFIIKVG